jgi:MFS family permease
VLSFTGFAGPWTLVAALSVGQLISWGSLYYSFSLFVAPMEADLGWSRADLNGALSVGLLVAGLFALPVGRLIDRRGAHILMTLGSLAGGALCLAWSQVDSIALFYLIWIGIGVVQAATLYEPAFAVITANLGGRYRQGITVLTLLGGLASTVFIPLTQYLIESIGWREALVVLAACNAVLCAGIHLVVLRGTRAQAAGRVPVKTSQRRDTPLRLALRNPAFWGIAAMVVTNALAFSALTFHIVPLLGERNVSMGTIIGIVAVIGPAQVAGRLVLLGFGARIRAVGIGAVSVVCLPVAILLLLLLPSTPLSLVLYALIYGAGNGIMTIARGTIVPEVLGVEGYATVNGALALPSLIAKAGAPLGAAAIWSATGSYDTVLWGLLGVALCGAAIYFAGTRPFSRRSA